MAFGGGAGSKFHLQEYKGKKPGLYKEEGIGTVRVGADGEVKFYRLGEKVPPVEETTTEDPTAPTAPTTRVSEEGVVQKGRTLGGVNKILKELGAGELADVSTAYQPEALVEGANPTQKPDVSEPFQQDPQLQTSFPEGTKPFASTDKYTAYSTGGNPEDPQDGTSSKPDRVERIRQVAFQPKGARQKEVSSRKAVRGNFGGDEPDTSTLVSPMYNNPMRNQIRDIYGDTSLSIAQQSAKVSELTGVYRYGGEGYANVGGKLVQAKDGSGRSLLNARGAGLDPREFLDIPSATPEEDAPSTPDLSKTDVTSPAFTTAQPEVQEWFKKELNKNKNAK